MIRSEFDRWLAEKAVAAGAELMTETTVRGAPSSQDADEDERRRTPKGRTRLPQPRPPYRPRPAVLGVRTSRGDIRSKLVIDCAGVTSSLVEVAGLRGPLGPRQLYHAIKHVFRLPEEEIDKRFKLREGEGCAINCFGDFMQGVSGSAFIFTNRETLSVGIVASMDSMVRAFTERFDRVGTLQDVARGVPSAPLHRWTSWRGRICSSSRRTTYLGGTWPC